MSEKPMEEAVRPTWNTLLVPSVQELVAKKVITEVPERYVRADQQEVIISESDDCPEIPVIDMQRLISEESSASSKELDKLHHACKHWGFFQVFSFLYLLLYLHILLVNESINEKERDMEIMNE